MSPLILLVLRTLMAAVQDGLIRPDDPACESLTEWKGDPQKSRTTYRMLLTSGGAARSMKSWSAIVASPMQSAPGERYVYGPYPIDAFGLALGRKLKGETFEAYLKRRVLDPLKVSVQWGMRCADGHPQLTGGGYRTARDWARFGEFVRKGVRGIVRSDLARALSAPSKANPADGLM